jgi:protein translocase SecG subunit
MFVTIFQVLAAVAGLAVIASMLMKTSSPDSGFSAAMGGGSSGGMGSRKGSMDELLDKVMIGGAIVWVLSCVLLSALSGLA